MAEFIPQVERVNSRTVKFKDVLTGGNISMFRLKQILAG
jgi:hypothetical protein